MDIKLIATDLDGTLLTADKKLSAKNAESLKMAAEKGIYIVPATGRPWIGVCEELKNMPFIRYALIMNGAMVWDSFENKAIYKSNFTTEQALILWDYVQKYETMTDAHVGGVGRISSCFYDNCEEYVESDAIASLLRATRIKTEDVRKLISESKDGAEKINLTFKDINTRNSAIKELKQFDFAIATSSVSNNIEINHINATKGKALSYLAEYLGIEMSQVMAFGDGSNDLSMIESAGLGVAMGNALSEIKAKAGFVTLDNNNDGVAYAIEKYVLS